MDGTTRTSKVRWIWPGLAALALAVGLITNRAAQAQTEFSKVTLIAPGAPATAWSEVEWLDPTGAWQTVEGWQGALETLGEGSTPLKQWTVYPENYGQGPFRWVVYAQMDGAVWGMSEHFDLPAGDGVNLRITVDAGTGLAAGTTTPAATGVVTATPAVTGTPAAAVTPAATSVVTATPAVTVTSAPVITGTPAATGTAAIPVTGVELLSDGLTLPTGCAGDDCDFAVITAYLLGAPAGSSAGVQWLDPSGAWRNVDGWQGNAAANDASSLVQRWTVYPENFGQGPFRWVVTQPDGAVWGVSPSFDLPTSGQHAIQFLQRPGAAE